jgi:hypothetical protein
VAGSAAQASLVSRSYLDALRAAVSTESAQAPAVPVRRSHRFRLVVVRCSPPRSARASCSGPTRRHRLWLDEAQAVAIARLPLSRLLHTLSSDGSPPRRSTQLDAAGQPTRQATQVVPLVGSSGRPLPASTYAPRPNAVPAAAYDLGVFFTVVASRRGW